MLSKFTSKFIKARPTTMVRPLARAFCLDFTVLPMKEINRVDEDLIIEVNNMLLGFQSPKELALQLKNANGYLVDKQLSYAMARLAGDNFPLDDGFYNDLLPILTQHVKLLTSQQADTYANIVMMAGDMGVEDMDFWSACKETLYL